jgi:hypothetical protein
MIGERLANPATTTKAKEKELFKAFMEVRAALDPSLLVPMLTLSLHQDFNTGTLPHEKYYDLGKYEKKMSAVRMGETVEAEGGYDFNKDLECAPASSSPFFFPSETDLPSLPPPFSLLPPFVFIPLLPLSRFPLHHVPCNSRQILLPPRQRLLLQRAQPSPLESPTRSAPAGSERQDPRREDEEVGVGRAAEYGGEDGE